MSSRPAVCARPHQRQTSCSYTEVKDLVSVIGDLDVLYMTRVQKERFFNEDDYLRLRGTYILDEAKMAYAKKDMAVLHPLRESNEIAVEVDDDPRCLLRTGQERHAYAHGIWKARWSETNCRDMNLESKEVAA